MSMTGKFLRGRYDRPGANDRIVAQPVCDGANRWFGSAEGHQADRPDRVQRGPRQHRRAPSRDFGRTTGRWRVFYVVVLARAHPRRAAYRDPGVSGPQLPASPDLLPRWGGDQDARRPRGQARNSAPLELDLADVDEGFARERVR